MPRGKTHDKFNLFVGAVITGVMIGFQLHYGIIVGFVGGWLLSTFIFTPDLDTMPKKRTKLLRLVLYPYSLFFKHRGVSHSLLFGTLTRIIYSVLIFFVMVFIFYKMNYLQSSPEDYFNFLQNFFLGFNYDLLHYKIVLWTYGGMFGADFSHLFLDQFFTIGKKL